MDKIDKIALYTVLIVLVALTGQSIRDKMPGSKATIREHLRRAIGKNAQLSELPVMIHAKMMSHDFKKFSYQEYLVFVANLVDVHTSLVHEELTTIEQKLEQQDSLLFI